ncbi:hypothetical protein, partial [Paraburkholderia caribensis]|uniref:hypothetical protein n=1 Tax=Paraburkholderia caribensis TaxID=75105 RepID=UPI001CC5D9B6
MVDLLVAACRGVALESLTRMHEVVGFATFTCLYATHGFGFLFLSATLGGFYGFVLASVIHYLVSRIAVRYFFLCAGVRVLRWHPRVALAFAFCGGIRVLRWHSRFALASAFCLRASSVAPVRG